MRNFSEKFIGWQLKNYRNYRAECQNLFLNLYLHVFGLLTWLWTHSASHFCRCLKLILTKHAVLRSLKHSFELKNVPLGKKWVVHQQSTPNEKVCISKVQSHKNSASITNIHSSWKNLADYSNANRFTSNFAHSICQLPLIYSSSVEQAKKSSSLIKQIVNFI